MQKNIAKNLLIAFSFVFLFGCNSSNPTPNDPTTASQTIGAAKVNEPFTLAPGQETTIVGTDLMMSFIAVKDDSRCPTDVTCIWAGTVNVMLKVSKANQETAEFQLGLNQSKDVGTEYTLKFTAIEPEKGGKAQQISASDYRATFVLEPLSSSTASAETNGLQ